jgi:predicted nucleic acid-binding protein
LSERPERLPETLSVDSGVVLAYLLGEKQSGGLVRSEILRHGRGGVYCAGPAVAELFYILCRRKGEKFAHEAVDALLGSGYVHVASSPELDVQAGSYKCERSISLADCYVLALARSLGAAAVFARREEDIVKEMGKREFDVGIAFLEDFE